MAYIADMRAAGVIVYLAGHYVGHYTDEADADQRPAVRHHWHSAKNAGPDHNERVKQRLLAEMAAPCPFVQ